MGPFDITSDDIKQLDDNQLREVLRLVVECEAKDHGIRLSSVRIGGHQNAADGGEDAHVAWTGGPDRTEWLPRRLSIFQSKAQSMPKSRLEAEMAPDGVPRPIFAELADEKGAYVIFSTDDCSEAMHKRRISAMRSILTDVP